MAMRRHGTAEQVQIVRELLAGTIDVKQAAQQVDASPSEIRQWRMRFVRGGEQALLTAHDD